MAEKHLEDDDPYGLVGVAYPIDDRVEADEIMARCFVEEYALMGMARDRVMRLFRSEFFAGTHAILQRRGEPFIQEIVDSVYSSATGEAL